MGIIISRFRKKSAADQLEHIEEEIKELEVCNVDTRLRHQKITKQLLIYSSGFCVIFAILLYFYIPPKLQTKIILIMLLLLSPLIYYIVNKIISWYYKRKITSSHSKLMDLKKEKKRLIDEIMNKEKYIVAKEILEKYAPEALPQKYPPRFNMGSPIMTQGAPGPMRNSPPGGPPAPMIKSQPAIVLNQANRPNVNPRAPTQSRQSLLALPPAGPRPSLSQGKSYVERFFEYLIGDGPNNRYALICSNCSTHNGMALQEEFEYTDFKCYACFLFNPARKQRPQAPKLEGEKSDRDTPEPDSCSSSMSEEQGNLRIEEIEDDDRENDLQGDSDSRTTIGEVRKLLYKEGNDDDRSCPTGDSLEGRTSSGGHSEDMSREARSEAALRPSTTSDDLEDSTVEPGTGVNGAADSGTVKRGYNPFEDDDN